MSDLERKFGLTEKILDEEITENHFHEIENILTKWEIAAPFLRVNVDDVKTYTPEPRRQQQRCLELFREHAGFKATYYKFLELLLQAQLGNTATKVCELLRQGTIILSVEM